MTPEVEAIAKACEAVFEFYFADAPPKASEGSPVEDKFEGEARVVVLGVEGTWRGNLVLSFRPKAISALTESFLGMPMEPGLEEAADEVLLELGNQIAARACREIEEAGIGRADLTPPSLIGATGKVRLAWNRPSSPVVVIGTDAEPMLTVAVGIARGPNAGALAG